MGITVSFLSKDNGMRQISLFQDETKHEKDRCMDQAMDDIRDHYGFYAVRRACTLKDRSLTEFNVKEDHTVHPTGYFQGRKMRL